MVVKHTLPSGLRVIVEPISHVRSVSVGIWIHTGSENETAKNNGISHFLEHMLFKGTEKRTARQLAEAFDEIGGQVNAFTSKEITCYYAKVLDQHFSTALEILTDMFLYSQLDAEELEKEKKVITEEIRMVEDTPDDLVHDLSAEASMGNHALGFPILGTTENVMNFQRKDLVAYRDKYYNPHNVVLSLAGHLPEDYLEQISTAFESFTGIADEAVRQPAPFTPSIKSKIKETEQTHICLGLPGIALTDSRIYHLILLNNILGGNMSSRLFQMIREDHGLAYSVFSYHSAYQFQGVLSIYAGTAHGQEDEVIECIYKIFADLLQHGLQSSELRKAKEQLKANLMLGLESTHNRMSRLGRNELLLGKHMTLDAVVETVEQIKLEEVNQLVQEIFKASPSLALVSPSGEIPQTFRRQ